MSDTGQRKKFFIDSKVQGAIVRQLVWHWLLAFAVMAGYLFLLELFSSGLEGDVTEHVSTVWSRYAPLVIVVVTMFPVFLYDSLKLSHRFAGPIVSLRRNLKKLANGSEVPPLRFRDGDYWHDLTDDFNRIAQQLGLSKGKPEEVPAK